MNTFSISRVLDFVKTNFCVVRMMFVVWSVFALFSSAIPCGFHYFFTPTKPITVIHTFFQPSSLLFFFFISAFAIICFSGKIFNQLPVSPAEKMLGSYLLFLVLPILLLTVFTYCPSLLYTSAHGVPPVAVVSDYIALVIRLFFLFSGVLAFLGVHKGMSTGKKYHQIMLYLCLLLLASIRYTEWATIQTDAGELVDVALLTPYDYFLLLAGVVLLFFVRRRFSRQDYIDVEWPISLR